MSDLERLFYWRGIASDYFNYRGEHVSVPEDNRLRLLEAMGISPSDPDVVQKDAFQLDVAPWLRWFPKLVVAEAGEQVSFDINLAPEDLSDTLDWRISNQEGLLVASGTVNATGLKETGDYLHRGKRFSRRQLCVGPLSANYYHLNVLSGRRSASTELAVCPVRAYQPAWLNKGADARPWGVLVQLYTLRSTRNWGMGDFTDLRELIEIAAEKGADMIGLNPLHALSTDLRTHFSPYSPSDRRYINPLYIDPVWIPEYTAHVKLSVDKTLRESLRKADTVDYDKMRALKYPVFQRMFTMFIEREWAVDSSRFQALRDFIVTEGDALVKFARYEAIRQSWPYAVFRLDAEQGKNADANNVFELEGSISQAIVFHCYLQWLAQKQLAECQHAAKKSGMKLGLIRDLAVGANGDGAEVQNTGGLFCRKAAIGAPPDPLAQTGQNWGLPPAIPSEMRKSGFKHFIALLRTNMRHCGALRIDHAMSLMRLWWCPPGTTADQGAYVYYPFPELQRLLALESQLNECLVVGEDLGVVPNEFREAMAYRGVFSNKLFYFERGDGERFKAPAEYDPVSLAMAANHDVPTLASWWARTDLALRHTLNLLEEGVSYEDMCAQRARDKENLMTALYDAKLYPASWHGRSLDEPADAALIEAILVLAARSASKLFVLQLEDLLMMDTPVNVPGTFDEHANWQRKLSVTTQAIFSDQGVEKIVQKIQHERSV